MTRILHATVLGGMIAAAAVTVACSSTSNGSPQPASSTSRSSSTAVPSGPVSTASTSAGGGASSSAFCHDFSSRALSDIASSNSVDKMYHVWTKLAADAPPQIKPDAERIRDFVKNAAAGHYDPSAVAKLSTAVQHISTYALRNCAGG